MVDVKSLMKANASIRIGGDSVFLMRRLIEEMIKEVTIKGCELTERSGRSVLRAQDLYSAYVSWILSKGENLVR
jgi:histone H3/H4